MSRLASITSHVGFCVGAGFACGALATAGVAKMIESIFA